MLKIIISIFLIVFVVIESLIIFYFKNSLELKSDYFLILGVFVKKIILSIILKGRLDIVLKYLKINDNCYVVVFGGKGSGEKIIEVKVMKDYFIKNGIDKNRIIEEDKFMNIYENFKYLKLKIEEYS